MRSLYTRYRPYILLLALTLVSSFALWLPFIQQLSFLGVHIPGTDTGYVYRHFDGPLYVIAAKSWYDPQEIGRLIIDIPLSAGYYAAHLPLYPLTIRVLNILIGIDPLKAMMLSTLVSGVLLSWTFYYVLKTLKITKYPGVLTAVMIMFPRLLVTRSVGTPEPMFLMLVVISLFFFEKKRYVFSGLAGALAVMTKSPSTLLAVAYGLLMLVELYKTRKIPWRMSWAPIGVTAGFVAVSLIYWAQYGDFFAYFNSGDNIHLVHPYAAFNREARWVGTAWLEDVLFYFAFYILSTITLFQQKYRSFFFFSLVFLIASSLVEHRDISRYTLPLLPLAMIAFERFFTSRRLVLMMLILTPGIYLYAWNFMQENVMPVSNWAPFL